MATTTGRAKLNDDQLVDMLGLIKGSDSVELKLTVPETAQISAVRALGMDALDAQIRQAYFLDTPDLALNRAGVVVRARRVQGRQADTVVKLRPVVPEELPEQFRNSRNMKVEVDAMPGGYVCSASMKAKSENQLVKEAVAGKRKISGLYTKEQRAFYRANAPEGLSMDDLSVLGPIFLLKLKFSPQGYGRDLVAELWLYPDGSRLLELSTTCPPVEAFDVAITTRAFLTKAGIDLSGAQETKTKRALEFYAKA